MTAPLPFSTTRWSVVLATRSGDEAARRALRELCAAYWYALYVHQRRSGRSDDDALEDVQSFLTEVLERGEVGGAGPFPHVERTAGPFRSYLLGALRHHVSNARRNAGTQRRGGHLELTRRAPLDDKMLSREPSPEVAYERAFAREVIAHARARLAAEWAARGRARVFEVLADVLDGAPRGASHAERAAQLGSTEGAVKVAVLRLRARLAELVREEVSATVAGAEDIDAELRDLCAALGGALPGDEDLRSGAGTAGGAPS